MSDPKPKVTVLYEDSRNAATNEFGPHLFVLALLADRLGERRWDRREVRANPQKGAGNVLKECRMNLEKLARGPGSVIAVYDADKVAALVNLPATSCKQEIVSRLKEDCTPQACLTVVLLEDNIETLVGELRKLGPQIVADDIWGKALGKSLNERDLVFKAARSAQWKEVRQKLVERVPSLARLVEKIGSSAFSDDWPRENAAP